MGCQAVAAMHDTGALYARDGCSSQLIPSHEGKLPECSFHSSTLGLLFPDFHFLLVPDLGGLALQIGLDARVAVPRIDTLQAFRWANPCSPPLVRFRPIHRVSLANANNGLAVARGDTPGGYPVDILLFNLEGLDVPYRGPGARLASLHRQHHNSLVVRRGSQALWRAGCPGSASRSKLGRIQASIHTFLPCFSDGGLS